MSRPGSRWLVSQSIDLMFVCGGLLWLFAGGHAFTRALAISELTNASSAMLLVGALIFTDTHFGTSYMQALGKSMPSSWRLIWPAVFILISAILLEAFPELVTNGCKLYLSAVVLHYAQQTINLTDKYGELNSYRWTRYQRMAVVTMIYGLAIHAILGQLIFRHLGLSTFLGPIPFP